MLDVHRVWPAAAIAAAFALGLVSLALAARVDAYVYWTQPGTGTIGRANPDGSGVDQSFITFGVGLPNLSDTTSGVAVDADHIYWNNRELGTIGRANLDGSGVDQSFITHGGNGVAVDASHVYWANFLGKIGRANLDGSDANPDFIITRNQLVAVAVDASHIYWTHGGPGLIGRANLDGSDANPFFFGSGHASGVAVDAVGHFYWSRVGPLGYNGVGRANLDGSYAKPNFITGVDGYPRGVAVDAGHVYWVANRPDTIGRANLGGTGVDETFITVDGDPSGVAVDAGAPPDTSITKRAPDKTEKTKVKFMFSSSKRHSTFECRLDKKRWKPCSSPKKLKRLKKGKHTFQVRAIDAAGNVDPTPARDRFKVVG